MRPLVADGNTRTAGTINGSLIVGQAPDVIEKFFASKGVGHIVSCKATLFHQFWIYILEILNIPLLVSI